MGNTTSDRKKELSVSSGASGRESPYLGGHGGHTPSTPRNKQKIVIQQSMNDDSELMLTGDDYGEQMRLRASTISQPSAITQGNLPTVFRWKGQGKQVYIAGSFNGWKAKIPLTKSQNDFVTILDLPEGQHEYKYFVDGQWTLDPDQKQTDNGVGSRNNMVEVKKSDFEVFDALAMDSDKGSQSTLSASPPGSYSQEIPNKKPYESSSGPPILPPHLMQVILNKDIPLTYEPTLLPEPNHVMLNHLYALSIKDGVMVLSATHRYRKKYVTTLMYKPI